MTSREPVVDGSKMSGGWVRVGAPIAKAWFPSSASVPPEGGMSGTELVMATPTFVPGESR
ncbi:MAG: hypothetical protein OXF41_05575 [bacterium]|nr:hypothetical protein [bacterium]